MAASMSAVRTGSGKPAQRPIETPLMVIPRVGKESAGILIGCPESSLRRITSPGCHVFLDDIGPGPRPIEKLRLVRSDLLANAGSGELGHPGEKRGPVGKSQFCHDIE